MSNDAIEGRCLCGAVRFSYRGTPNWTLHCHCESCRRATSSPITTWISVPLASFHMSGPAKTYSSSPGVQRRFCGTCGTPLAYENAKMPNEVHLYAASLLDPSVAKPSRHVFVQEQLSWFEVHDALPRFATTSRGTVPIRIGPRTD